MKKEALQEGTVRLYVEETKNYEKEVRTEGKNLGKRAVKEKEITAQRRLKKH